MLQFNQTNYLMIKRSLVICKLNKPAVVSNLDAILKDIELRADLDDELQAINHELNVLAHDHYELKEA